MGNPAGVKRDFEALEKRRMQAICLLEKNDLNQSEVARRLHVCRQTVSRWADEFKAGGKPALKKAGRAGRKPQLSQAERARLEELLVKGPERLGYETPLWTCARVAHLIQTSSESSITGATSGNCLWIWAGAVSGPRDGRASARKTRSGAGDACAGLPLKKSPPARAHDHLHRRKRSKPAAASLPDLVASRRHTRSAVQFQLEDVVGRGRDHLLQLLFPALSRHGEEPAGDRFPGSSAAAHLRTAADRVGPAGRSSERHGTRLHLRTG